MKNKLVTNYLYNLSYQLLILITPIITLPYVSRVLGLENVGLFNFFQSLVSYFILLGTVGMNLYGQREVAFCKKNRFRRTRVFCELQIIRFVTVTASAFLYYFIIIKNSTGYSRYYALFLVEIIAAFFDVSWFFQGVEDFRVQAIRNFFTKTLGVVAVFTLVKTENDLDVYIVCYCLIAVFSNVIMWFSLPKYLGRTNIQLFGILKHIAPIILMFLPQIAISAYAYLDKIMIRIFFGQEYGYLEVGYYSQAEKITKIVLTVVTSLGAVMLSRVANRYSAGDIKAIHKYIKKSFNFLFVIAFPAAMGLMAVSKDMIPWFLGEDYKKSAICMMVLAPIILFIGVSNIIGTQYLLPTNRVKEYTVSVAVGLVVNVAFNSLLIGSYGSIGAAISTVLAELTVTMVQIRFAKRDFDIKGILLGGWRSLLSALIMGAVVGLAAYFMESELISTLIQVGIGIVVYFVMLLVLKEPFVFGFASKIFKRKGSKINGN